jgi:hypothetical protein
MDMNYTTVNERLIMALAKYPDLRIQEHPSEIITTVNGETLICTVTIWRDAIDERPVIASAAEIIPGRTPFTKFSERENGFTSAVGRGLGYMGFGIDRSIATSDDIQNAGGTLTKPTLTRGTQVSHSGKVLKHSPAMPVTDAQRRFIKALGHTGGMPTSSSEASTLIENLKKQKEATAEEPF